MYAETLKMNQGYVKAYANYLIAVEQLVSPQLKIQYYNELLSIAGERYDPYYKKAFVFGKQLNNLDSALVNLNRAFVFDSNRVECLSALGIVYAMKGDYKKSALYLEKGYKIDPNDPNIVNNLIVTLSNLGDKERVKSLTGSRPDKH
jgi:tetratricopeptide (TPR) repeat protein